MEIFHARNTASFTKNNRPIKPLHEVAHDLDTLKADVCDFIVEIRKENGEQYPANTLYDLLQALSLFLQREKGFNEKLMSGAFKEVRNTLDNMMKERSHEGVGKRPERESVTAEHEQILWEKNVLGESNPDQLRKTVFFLLGCRLGLRGCEEHYDLRRYPDSQINIIKVNAKDALIYREFASKTCQGGLRDRNKGPPNVRYAFCSGFRPRCLVELYRKYMLLGPKGSHNWPRFYVQTDPSWTPGSLYWYTNRTVGKNTIAEYMKKIMEAGGIEGFYRNHSLRKTTATCLFEQGVDPQLIQEQTGHKSNAIMLYKQSNLKMKKKVSDMLNVLLREMQEIRDRENVMLDREEQFEMAKKKSPSSSISSKPKSNENDSRVDKSDQKHVISEKKMEVVVDKSDQKHVVSETKMESKQQVVIDQKGLDVHVPVNTLQGLSNLQGLVNIHFHIYTDKK